MSNFGTERKGYCRAEVDAYILKREQETRRVTDDQLDRIRAQREELDRANAALAEYRSREKYISDAMIAAREDAGRVRREARAQYEAELAALRAFHAKWTAQCRRILEKYPLDHTLEKLAKCNADVTNAIEENLGGEAARIIANTAHRVQTPAQRQYDEEAQRLGGINMRAVSEVLADSVLEDSRYDRIAAETWSDGIAPEPVRSYLESQIDPRTGVDAAALAATVGTDGFSFEEALHPTEDLGDIMADFGLGSESASAEKGKKKK